MNCSSDAKTDDEDDRIVGKPGKKLKTESSTSTLDNFLTKGQAKPSKVQRMNPKSPPKAKKAPAAKVTSQSDEGDDTSAEMAPQKRVQRRAARAPAKYIDVSSDNEGMTGTGDDSFV